MPSPPRATPPGIDGNLKHVVSGGDDAEWMPFETRKLYTNAFIVQDGKVLLGYKKRGFGKHKYNGFGGKVEDGETSQEAALRELEEEAGITAPLEYAGTLLFLSEGSDVAFHIDIYRAEEYSGTIAETDEMRPEWFALPSINPQGPEASSPSIPFAQMWDTDVHWMPLLFSKTAFVGRADFKREGDVFAPHKWWFGVSADVELP
ncbi:putative NUDIX domain containing protein [Lyophyllum shimeji]|uniref:Oxidized purine nucleoside triphosphate hydrolase n=1 Tax=Lyophyllum shimeji TaxID=47721 RepID=A0A9P3PP99_LYOSH|nr:putative NUDIX domain containing protein [Lyophyllum shimeji]